MFADFTPDLGQGMSPDILAAADIRGVVGKMRPLARRKNGIIIGNFEVVVEKHVTCSAGESKVVYDHIDCFLEGYDARKLAHRYPTGTPVHIVGELREGRWRAEEGIRSKLQLAVYGMSLWDEASGA